MVVLVQPHLMEIPMQVAVVAQVRNQMAAHQVLVEQVVALQPLLREPLVMQVLPTQAVVVADTLHLDTKMVMVAQVAQVL
jgi:hypothetical protein